MSNQDALPTPGDHLAIVRVAEDGSLSLIKDIGPSSVAEYIQFAGEFVRRGNAEQDWDTVLDTLMVVLVREGILTKEEGFIANGYDMWSILDLIMRLSKLMPESAQEHFGFKIGVNAIKSTMRFMQKGKSIQVDDLEEIGKRLQEPFMRQLMRSADRRAYLAQVFTEQVLLADNPPRLN